MRRMELGWFWCQSVAELTWLLPSAVRHQGSHLALCNKLMRCSAIGVMHR